MELTEEQKTMVKQWVDEGCGLSEIQRRLTSEFDMRPTFIDVRLLILDLGLEIKEANSQKSAKAEEPELPDTDTEAELAEELPAEDESPVDEGVSVEVDRIVKPGTVLSGSVTFSDGVKASWMLDQVGRLALDSLEAGYRPPPDDIEKFQRALQTEIAKKGY